MNKQTVQPQSLSTPASAYSPGLQVEAQRLVFTSGQVPEDAEGNLVGEGDFEAQARQVFANIRAIMQQAGGDLSNVVKLTVFLTDMANFPTYSKIRGELLSKPYPVSTLVQVSSLVLPEWMIEVEAIGAF